MTPAYARSRALVLAVALFVSGCGSDADDSALTGSSLPPAGTPEARGALFDTILARSARRDAFSPVKNDSLGFNPLADMAALRDVVVGADTEEDLFYALARLSHARRDRHLDVALVPGGIRPSEVAGLDVWDGEDAPEPRQAPVRVFPDYGEEGGYFIGDVADHASTQLELETGDRVLSVNGVPIPGWEEDLRPWTRHSSHRGLRWKMAEAMTRLSGAVPPTLREDRLRLEVTRPDGSHATYQLPYFPADELQWRGVSEPRYTGLESRMSTVTFDLLVPTDGRRFLVLVWTGFRETMVADVGALLDYAAAEGLLDHAVIMDVTRSGGGSLGPYAVQRLQPRPFKTTFGTLRLSDVIEPFVESKRADFQARDVNDGGVPETIDDGSWLMDWLENEVLEELAAGAEHTAPVPFKLAHAPKDSDGVLPPASGGFRGAFGVISGPSGGSHLDQFNAIVKDNGLGPIVGMPAGGYSNTWEWEEVLHWPGTDQSVVGFMYDIGFTIRPNGEVLEGNPADVDEWIPLTAEGHTTYYDRMLQAVLARLGM